MVAVSLVVNEHEKELWSWNYRRKDYCINCGAPLPERRRSFCSDECSREFSYTELQEDIHLGHRDWRLIWWEVREEILERDDFTCRVCGFRADSWHEARKLHVHHIKPISKGGKCIDPDNLITLCEDCHKRTFRNKYRGVPMIRRTKQLTLEEVSP